MSTSNILPLPDEEKEIIKALGFTVGWMAGSGAFGDVYKGVCNENAVKFYKISEKELKDLDLKFRIIIDDTGIWVERPLFGLMCAIKKLDDAQCRHIVNTLQEASVMVELEHPNIVEIYNVLKTPSGSKYIITEYINGGTLFKLDKTLTREGGKIKEWDLKVMFEDVLAGLKYLHDKKIAHNDLHSGNIMLHYPDSTRPKMLQMKLIDFGIVKYRSASRGMNVVVDFSNDYRRLGSVFKRLLILSAISNPTVAADLKRICERMSNDYFSDMKQILTHIKPVLAYLERPPASEQPIPVRGSTDRRSLLSWLFK